jgi:glyoxylase-like metal-dependent hydrolase (beta-lactamase superfamily II)
MSTPGEAQHHSYAVGSIGVTVLREGQVTVPLSPGFVGNAPLEAVQAALAAAGLPTDTLTTSFAPVLLDTAGQRVLIDTGLGADGRPRGAGRTLDALASAGVSAAEVDVVVISHFHGDHVNGLLAGSEPVFPNARVLVPAVEHAFFTSDTEQARATPGRMQELFASNRRILDALGHRVSRYSWDDEVVPGLKAVAAPGHSIGHTCFLVESAGTRVFMQSDLTNHVALFLPHPEWWAAFDQDPQLAVATRRRFYDWAATERVAVQAFHHPFPGLSRLEPDGTGYRRIPLDRP